ncbi:hypothetical protein [Dyella subtropica]|uniref:hypothetical protein n=1 Tax=Dyella subtropica TaxID=2992127 RepID=UPI00224D5F83|nr:hypothetical protein [Dyella subtropica]
MGYRSVYQRTIRITLKAGKVMHIETVERTREAIPASTELERCELEEMAKPNSHR